MPITHTKTMSYYNYHGNAINLIKNGHCEKAEIVQNYNNISPALILYFNNHKPMPIRQERFEQYMVLLKYFDVPTLINNQSVDKK